MTSQNPEEIEGAEPVAASAYRRWREGIIVAVLVVLACGSGLALDAANG